MKYLKEHVSAFFILAAVSATMIVVARLLSAGAQTNVSEMVADAFALVALGFGAYVTRRLARRLSYGEFRLGQAMQEVNKLTHVMDASFDGVVLTDARGVIRHVNPKWERITGWTAEETVGKLTPQILKSGYHDQSFYSDFWLTIERGNLFRGELINRRKDGGYYKVDELVLPIKDLSGRVTGYAAFHHVIDPDYKPSGPPGFVHEYTEAS